MAGQLGTEEVIFTRRKGSFGDFPLLRVPGKARTYTPSSVAVGSRANEFAILPQPLLRAMLRLNGLLKGVDEIWAIGGDAGELAQGVSVKADLLEIITTKSGSEKVASVLTPLATPIAHPLEDVPAVSRPGSADARDPQADSAADHLPWSEPRETEKKLEREADCSGMRYPVFVRSNYAEMILNGVRLEVHGDLQFRVGELDWGDPLTFEPARLNVVGSAIPVVPLELKSELYLGLGWLDRVERIAEAFARSKQHIAR